ncbi:MAG: hypothetical protein KA978_28140 [Deltaproteobacteria bacterium]|nr:hypothetical protein [Deltaproteobacteria bacterium]
MTNFPRESLRKVQPFLIPASLTVAIEAAMKAMQSPMFPRVTITFAARELLMQGCDALERDLEAARPITWTVADPPRGPRRREEQVRPRSQRVRDDTYSQLSPIALPEALITRLHQLQRRLTTATRKKVSFAKLVREALARGCVERERVLRDSEAFVRANAGLLALAGFPDASRIRVVASGVSTPYAPTESASRKPRPVKTLTPRSTKGEKPSAKASTASRPRARTPRRKGTPRRVATGDEGDEDGGGDGPEPQLPRRGDVSPFADGYTTVTARSL